MPFVDASGIHSETELQTVIGLLRRALPAAEETGVELHLETALYPPQFARLLAALPHAKIRVNYDSGNSSSLGYHPRDEFAAYGDRVGSVHIKDRVRGGGTVPLGSGDADLPAFFECLRKVNYQGDFILQVARDGRRRIGLGTAEPGLRRSASSANQGGPMKFLMLGLGGIGQRHLRNLRALAGPAAEVLAYRVRRQSHVLTDQLQIENQAGLEEKYSVRLYTDLDAGWPNSPLPP